MKTLKLIQEIKEEFPQLRIGQILSNATDGELFYITDADLYKALKRLQAFISKK